MDSSVGYFHGQRGPSDIGEGLKVMSGSEGRLGNPKSVRKYVDLGVLVPLDRHLSGFSGIPGRFRR